MFGFLPGPCGCFSRQDRSLYRSHFCGLCNALRSRYGLWARWLVNRDAAFLSLLGSALRPAPPVVSRATCCNPWAKPRELVQCASHVEYAAAVTVCGLAAKLQDDAQDERGPRRWISKLGARAVRRFANRAVGVLKRSGFRVRLVMGALAGQLRRESASTPGSMEAVQPTRFAYGEIFAHLPSVTGTDPAQAGALRRLGENLGELIYVTDAWDDFDEDCRKGRFNPLPQRLAERVKCARAIGLRCVTEIRLAVGALHLHHLLPLTRQILLMSMPSALGKRWGVTGPDGRPVSLQPRKPSPQKPFLESGGNGPNCCDGCDSGCDPNCCDCANSCDPSSCHSHGHGDHGASCDGCCHGCHGCDGCDACCHGCDCSCH
jgi:hypothetical protein